MLVSRNQSSKPTSLTKAFPGVFGVAEPEADDKFAPCCQRGRFPRLREILAGLRHHQSVDRKDLQMLSRIRLREARALAKLGMSDGAYYLAGYSVECAIKACIAKFTKRHEFPDKKRADSSYSHVLKDLVTVARLERVHSEELNSDTTFRKYWNTVQSWSERSRYVLTSSESAKQLIEAVGNPKHGVLRWVKLHW